MVNANDLAINLTSVRKAFRIYDNTVSGPVRQMLFGWTNRKYYKEFVAVKDVSLQVKRGEVVGVIGPNGSGKTTLLKVIAGLLKKDGGDVQINGSVTALLALGVGIHPEFTGRENILFGGILLGMSKEEVVEKTESIIEFSELGDFIDLPFRTYSSGMKSRLLFSISMSIDPDILIVDEALATGDIYFVRKCSKRISELCDGGTTILFVSHNHRQIQELCSRAYLMWEGNIVADGKPSDVIAEYNSRVFSDEQNRLLHSPDFRILRGTGEVQVSSVSMKDHNGKETKGFYTGKPVTIDIDYRCFLKDETNVTVSVGLLRSKELDYIGMFNSNFTKDGKFLTEDLVSLSDRGTLRIKFGQLLLKTGDYSLWILFLKDGRFLCEYKGVSNFFVAREDDTSDRDGYYIQPGNIEVLS